MSELALFAGIGGGILGTHFIGINCVCAVERNEHRRVVLMRRQNERHLPPFPIWDDVQTFDGRPWRGIVDVLSGGFPCQDISAAGKGAGIDGERSSMWKHMARVVCEVKPRWVFVENSPILTIRGLGTVLRDLATLGFDAEWVVLSARDDGAIHVRERAWILATNNRCERRKGGKQRPLPKFTGFPWGEDVRGIEDLRNRPDLPEPLICSVNDGLSEELGAYGNAVVPQIPELIGRAILNAERKAA